jgi:hypothetical protein
MILNYVFQKYAMSFILFLFYVSGMLFFFVFLAKVLGSYFYICYESNLIPLP